MKCNAMLVSQAVPDRSFMADRATPLMDVRAMLTLGWNRLGDLLAGSVPQDKPIRYPWTAAYLALIPGMGQFYNYQPVKALLVIVGWAILAGLFVYSLLEPWNDFVAIAWLFWVFYVMADGYVISRRINGEEWNFRQVTAVWFAMMFFAGVGMILAQYLGTLSLFWLTTSRSPVLYPHIASGDKVFVLSPVLAGDPRPGDLVYYNPGRYSIESGGNISSVNERNSFGVVTGVPGEVVAVGMDGVVRVDGEPVSANRLPPFPNGTGLLRDLRVEPDHSAVLISHGAVESTLIGKVVGGGFAGSVPAPRNAGIMKGLEEAQHVSNDDYQGVVLFCYYPPQRRRWFGRGRGLWTTPPPDYPTPFRGY